MKIFFVSLGCDKNLVDSEVMLGLLRENNYTFTDDEYEADVIIVNTCGFINDAKEESINMILEMAKLKENNLKALIVTGCLTERYKAEIMKGIPEIDACLGTTAYDEIVNAVKRVTSGDRCEYYSEPDKLLCVNTNRVITTGGHYAYLKISEGCDKNCTYCAIPKIRGKYRSYPMEYLITEASKLAASGVKELILVAQETTVYGVDLYGKKSLHILLKELCKINGIEWIRILYCYPEEIYDELIDVIKTEDKICKYLDIPIQHANDKILRKMGRRMKNEDLRRIITKLRKEIPDICLRTTLITGFPSETDEDFEEMMDFVDEMEFDRLGVFAYSAEEDTPAALFDGQVDEEVKIRRRNLLMELQQDISYDKGLDRVGNVYKVMIEGKLTDEEIYVGRTYMDCPGVDGLIFVKSPEEVLTGDFIYAKVTGAKEYDLIGEREYEFT